MSYEIRCPKCLAEYNSRMVYDLGSTLGKVDASCLVCGFGKQFQEQKTQESVKTETKTLLKDSGFNMKTHQKMLND